MVFVRVGHNGKVGTREDVFDATRFELLIKREQGDIPAEMDEASVAGFASTGGGFSLSPNLRTGWITIPQNRELLWITPQLVTAPGQLPSVPIPANPQLVSCPNSNYRRLIYPLKPVPPKTAPVAAASGEDDFAKLG